MQVNTGTKHNSKPSLRVPRYPQGTFDQRCAAARPRAASPPRRNVVPRSGSLSPRQPRGGGGGSAAVAAAISAPRLRSPSTQRRGTGGGANAALERAAAMVGMGAVGSFDFSNFPATQGSSVQS